MPDATSFGNKAAYLLLSTGPWATGGWTGGAQAKPEEDPSEKGEDLDAIKKQLAELQDKLSKLK